MTGRSPIGKVGAAQPNEGVKVGSCFCSGRSVLIHQPSWLLGADLEMSVLTPDRKVAIAEQVERCVSSGYLVDTYLVHSSATYGVEYLCCFKQMMGPGRCVWVFNTLETNSPSFDTIMKLNMLFALGLCAALTTGAMAQDDKAVKEARKQETRRDVKKVGDKVENGVADGAHAVGTAGRAVGKAGKTTGKAVANGAKATGRAVTKATKATGRAISGEAKKVEN